ncbi:hypothetical protein IC620_16570 [Hazenella sp. IB182357]|uniref:Uncharacterized protein n=1 Tax=Polycladospora coralii TaxID=2771432 RepID=A0A926NC86_9BACL|nr:hypothetical protein [Polycladospora coralii]MBD1373958.1 hypothetical protein [Polycladospora coralii]
MTDIQAFLAGYKPSFLFTPNHDYPHYANSEMEQLNKYPSFNVTMNSRDHLLYTQTIPQRENIKTRLETLSPDTYEYEKIIGEALGFPPGAVEVYQKIKLLPVQRVGINYIGINFVTSVEHLTSDVQWLWSTYNNQSDAIVEVFYKPLDEWFNIQHLDTMALQRVYSQIHSSSEKEGSVS